jgi:ubiquitin carboxyl-terminal hydrolase L3
MCTVWTKRWVCIASKFHVVDLDYLRQLLALVPKPVKALVLLFPIRGKLEELSKEEEAKFKEKGQVPIDPTVFWIKQTVRPSPGKTQCNSSV